MQTFRKAFWIQKTCKYFETFVEFKKLSEMFTCCLFWIQKFFEMFTYFLNAKNFSKMFTDWQCITVCWCTVGNEQCMGRALVDIVECSHCCFWNLGPSKLCPTGPDWVPLSKPGLIQVRNLEALCLQYTVDHLVLHCTAKACIVVALGSNTIPRIQWIVTHTNSGISMNNELLKEKPLEPGGASVMDVWPQAVGGPARPFSRFSIVSSKTSL